MQASYVLMNREANIDRVRALTAEAAGHGAELVVFPEAFVPGTPVWIDTRPIWDGDDEWFRLLYENTVVVGSQPCERLADVAATCQVWLVVGVQEREATGGSIYNTILYFSPEGVLVGRHRKLVPTGSERTVWTPGDGSTLDVVPTPWGRIGGLTCMENFMPLARFHMYAQGVDVWLAPTLAQGDGWVWTMQHRDDLYPEAFVEETGPWVEPGNTVIVGPDGGLLAGPVREREETLVSDLDLGKIAAARRIMDPVGHYNRPDVFQLQVDTRRRAPVQIVTDHETRRGI